MMSQMKLVFVTGVSMRRAFLSTFALLAAGDGIAILYSENPPLTRAGGGICAFRERQGAICRKRVVFSFDNRRRGAYTTPDRRIRLIDSVDGLGRERYADAAVSPPKVQARTSSQAKGPEPDEALESSNAPKRQSAMVP